MEAADKKASPPKKVKLFAFGVAIMIAVVPATLFCLNEVRHLRDASHQYSRLLDAHLQQAIAENRQLWKYSAPKFIEITRHRQWFPDIVEVSFYDTDYRLIHAEQPDKSVALVVFPTQYQVRYQGELYGIVQVQNRLDRALLWTVLLFLLGCAGGGALGYGIYACSSRLMRQAEQAKRELLEEMATHDVTTGIHTIIYVSRMLAQLFSNPAGLTSVLLLDIDFFRNYNDLHGYEKGNDILREVTQVLIPYLRETDVFGRFGGEEFIVVLPDTSLQQAAGLASRLRVAVEAHDFPGADYQPKGRLTVSIGVASSETAATCQELFHQLDNALYKAKSAGRNYVCAFSVDEPATKPVNLQSQSPGMKAEVTRKFISRFFHSAEAVSPELHEPTIRAFLKALEIWDPGTVRHSLRVNRIAMEIAKAMDLPKADSLTLNLGTLLHDIGKLTIGDTILVKPGKLTEDEYELMKNHPRVGYDLIRDDPVLHKASDIIIMHHERFDGTGYPLRLAGKQIPLLARICAVADAIDAMMIDRPYSKGKTMEEVRLEIARNRGKQFDPEIVDVVLGFDWNIFHHISVAAWSGMTVEQEQA